MRTLDFNDFNCADGTNWERFAETVRDAVKSSQVALIRHFGVGETNEQFIKLAYSLGTPHGGYSLPEHPLEDGLIFRVEVRGEGIIDPSGSIIYSTTFESIPCHTDGVNRPMPYDLVLLHCIRQDESGGETILITLREIMARLATSVLELLREEAYPFAFGKAPIIAGDEEKTWIRYNAQEMAFYSEGNVAPLSPRHLHALDQLEAALSETFGVQEGLRLSPGECLVIDNKRVLHGRSPCLRTGSRLLKRIRLYW